MPDNKCTGDGANFVGPADGMRVFGQYRFFGLQVFVLFSKGEGRGKFPCTLLFEQAVFILLIPGT